MRLRVWGIPEVNLYLLTERGLTMKYKTYTNAKKKMLQVNLRHD